MDFFELEEKIELLTDDEYGSILKLIASAMQDYPVYNLRDTNAYFADVRKI